MNIFGPRFRPAPSALKGHGPRKRQKTKMGYKLAVDVDGVGHDDDDQSPSAAGQVAESNNSRNAMSTPSIPSAVSKALVPPTGINDATDIPDGTRCVACGECTGLWRCIKCNRPFCVSEERGERCVGPFEPGHGQATFQCPICWAHERKMPPYATTGSPWRFHFPAQRQPCVMLSLHAMEPEPSYLSDMALTHFNYVSDQNSMPQYFILDIKINGTQSRPLFVDRHRKQLESWENEQTESPYVCVMLCAQSDNTGHLRINSGMMTAESTLNLYLGDHMITQLKKPTFSQKMLILVPFGPAVDNSDSFRHLQGLVSSGLFDTVISFGSGFVRHEKISIALLKVVAEFGSVKSAFDWQKKVFAEFCVMDDLGSMSVNII